MFSDKEFNKRKKERKKAETYLFSRVFKIRNLYKNIIFEYLIKKKYSNTSTDISKTHQWCDTFLPKIGPFTFSTL